MCAISTPQWKSTVAGRIHERGNGNENSSKKVGGAVIQKFGPISQFGDFRSIIF